MSLAARCALALALALSCPLRVQAETPACHATPPGAGLGAKVPWREPLPRDRVRLHLVEQSMTVIGTRNLLAVADYSGFISHDDGIVPDIVTMNAAHQTHKTDHPDPRIAHVLRGWPVDGEPARHRLHLPEMVVRNITSDTRGSWDGLPPTKDGNAIFVFEAAGLCIGHFSHLQTPLNAAQRAGIGHLDVAIVPVDNGWAMDHAEMAAIARSLGAQVLIPSHWSSETTLEVFLSDLSADWMAVDLEQPSVDLSPETLPAAPTILILRPAFLPCRASARCGG